VPAAQEAASTNDRRAGGRTDGLQESTIQKRRSNMPSSKVTVQHQLGKDEALRRIKDILGEAKNNGSGRISDVQETWTDDGGSYSFKVAGFSVNGSIDVRDTDV